MSVNLLLSNAQKEKTNIDIIVLYKGKRYKRSTGLSVLTEYWNKGMCRENRQYPEGKSINLALKKIKNVCEQVLNECTERLTCPTAKQFWERVDEVTRGISSNSKQNITFLDYFKKYINTISQRRDYSTIKSYTTTYNILYEYQCNKKSTLYFEDINMSFYDDLLKFLSSYSCNYFGTIIKHIKIVYKEARDTDKLHNRNDTAHRDFVTTSETADTVYLNEEELKRIYECDLSVNNVIQKLNLKDLRSHNISRKIEALKICRNKFLISCYTALRVSDINRLKSVNISDRTIDVETLKTGAKVSIPIHPIVRDILNSGFKVETRVSPQKLNDTIKELCLIAGIDDTVEYNKTIGGKKRSFIKKKYELVTNHTARRSGATNMYKAGIPTISIMKLTGHTTEKSFMKYIKISQEENAEILMKHDFFK